MELKISIDELRKKSLFIGTPMYGGKCEGVYCQSIIDLQGMCLTNEIPFQNLFIYNESLITRARNVIVDEFLQSDATHLMFIDSDIGFKPVDVLALMALEKPVIGGLYPRKMINWNKIAETINGKLEVTWSDLDRAAWSYVYTPVEPGVIGDQPFLVDEVGTGFMLIERSVFEKIREYHPELEYRPDQSEKTMTAFYDTAIEPISKRYLSEDYAFCGLCRRVGIGVWVCPWMRLEHMGTYNFGQPPSGKGER